MEILKVQAGEAIARQKDKVNMWYLIQEGKVAQKFGFSEVILGKNAIIGILESDTFMCDYIAKEDATFMVFSCTSIDELRAILAKQEKTRGLFIHSAIEQKHNILCLYSELFSKVNRYHAFLENIYEEYKNICTAYGIEGRGFAKMDKFDMIMMHHRAENWEILSSRSLVKNLNEYIQLMVKDEDLAVGTIMETAAQMRRFTQGIREMEEYLSYNKDILMCESENDIFMLYYELAVTAHRTKNDVEPVREKISKIMEFIKKLNIYDERLCSRRFADYKEYDFDSDGAKEQKLYEKNFRKEMDIMSIDCLKYILEYAQMAPEELENTYNIISDFGKLSDPQSMDEEIYKLRKQVSALFYDVYQRCFFHAVEDEESITPIVEMFLNFGFMDKSFLSEKTVLEIYSLTEHLGRFNSDRVYTMYRWLKAIYMGEKEPSKNELDMNYSSHLADLYKNGRINKEQMAMLLNDREMKVEFEINNMFATVNKLTYGRITTFCPILCERDFVGTLEKMMVTSQRLEDAMSEVCKVDYSVFYRDVPFSDPEKGINSEMIVKEILPDIILMPNAGSRAMMWQETSGVKSATPGRFAFSIFVTGDLNEMMLETIGRFRWDICRTIQGMRWNDFREKSLTAEYCTYIQFYKKNHELSTEAKEKIKLAMARAKNNYREVFVKDYVNWIKYESKGSFRLNKISRDVLIKYCPFSKTIRNNLVGNPVYQQGIQKYEADVKGKLKRYAALYEKYKRAGGELTPSLVDNIMFYQM